MTIGINGINPTDKTDKAASNSRVAAKDTTAQDLQKAMQKKENPLKDIPNEELTILYEIVDDKMAEIDAKIKLAEQKNDTKEVNALKAQWRELKEQRGNIAVELESRKPQLKSLDTKS